MTDGKMTFGEVASALDETWANTSWQAGELRHDGGTYRGTYHVRLADDWDERAPHRPLLHGSTLYQIAEYHALVSLIFAYANRHYPAFDSVPAMTMAEARRRFLLTSVRLDLHKPIFASEVPVQLRVDRLVNKMQKHRLVFFDGFVSLGDGEHEARMGGCLNLRDDLIATGDAATDATQGTSAP
ncbi:hypothetical protein HUO13_06860 [Saccharopolyspora erythraea]|uniref:hypothetical protein n=1 Tax=Saccharopolyspora erythraea TaxID=1836 RepID=UPI001BABE640|nr:hypothetical protein [Saccharopolyspora erythraea]QUH00576.1 hypothetical protein HUO13_06860 [Saccharopolyspora erythraea]